MIGQIFGNYRVIRELGAGGMGSVYEAQHTSIGKRVALKVLPPHLGANAEFVKRFFGEAQSASSIRHPGIVDVFDFGREGDRLYMTMELLVGETLGARLTRPEPLDVGFAVELTRQVAEAMEAAHACGIIHRDLKPANLFLVADPGQPHGVRVKVLDFGIAKILHDQSTGPRTQAGAVMGTPAYMSPEQCRDSGLVDHRSDVYALGCILFEAACGGAPFRGDEVAVMAEHLNSPPPSLRALSPSVSPRLERICQRAMAKRPADRFQSMAAFAASLASLDLSVPSQIVVEPGDDLLLGRSVGNYVVVRKLGAGGMGSVYLLQHKILPNTFQALKAMNTGPGGDSVRDRFDQEAHIAASIGNHRVVRPLDMGQFPDGIAYIIMEYVAGRSLAEVIRADGPMPVTTALEIVARVADTMIVAHLKRIIHRDLKPANVMLEEIDGRSTGVRLLDFGVARATGEIKRAHTRDAAVIGTPGYMSPEAWTGLVADGRTDVFSLAVILFELLTGELPFPSPQGIGDVLGFLAAEAPSVGQRRPAHLDPAPRDVDVLVARGLQKDPAFRPTMAEFHGAILAALRAIATEREKYAPLAPSIMESSEDAIESRPTLSESAVQMGELLGRVARNGGATPLPNRQTPIPASTTPRPEWNPNPGNEIPANVTTHTAPTRLTVPASSTDRRRRVAVIAVPVLLLGVIAGYFAKWPWGRSDQVPRPIIAPKETAAAQPLQNTAPVLDQKTPTTTMAGIGEKSPTKSAPPERNANPPVRTPSSDQKKGPKPGDREQGRGSQSSISSTGTGTPSIVAVPVSGDKPADNQPGLSSPAIVPAQPGPVAVPPTKIVPPAPAKASNIGRPGDVFKPTLHPED